jgi:hypothetical protein
MSSPPVSRLAALSLAVPLALAACLSEPDDLDELDWLDDSASELTRPVDPARELLITDPSVIAAPDETTFDPAQPSGTDRRGAWSFGRLIHNMLPRAERNSPAAASAFVMRWLATWEVDQAPEPTVSAAAARPSIRLLVIEPWKAASGCAEPASPATDDACVLDMARAPFRLIAIVNRPDLREVAGDDRSIGGEGRFVFQVVGPTLAVDPATGAVVVMDPTPAPQKFTVIFEYSLPVPGSDAETIVWARRWHQLGALPFGRSYNAQLRAITSAFAGPDADLRRPNGNALNQLRTNEVALKGARFPDAGFAAGRQVWELREFRLTAAGLAPHTVNLEPSRDFDVSKPGQTGAEGSRTAELVDFLSAEEEAVVAMTHRLPAGMSGNSTLVGSAPYGAWGRVTASGPHGLEGVSDAARDAFALGTCAGCHRHETDTRHFMHITALGAMEPADRVDDRARIGVAPGTPDDTVVLSNFMRGEIEPGGPRFEDFRRLLTTNPAELMNKPGLRACR